MILNALFVLLMAIPSSQLRDAAETARKSGSPDATVLYQKALKVNPSWQEGWWALGNLEYAKDRYPQCRDAFGRLSQLAPKAGPALTMLGLCDVGLKDLEPALDHLSRGMELGAGNDAITKTARYHLARLYTRAGMFERALALIVQLAETAPESPPYLQLAGTAALWKPAFPEDVPSQDRELVYFAGKAFWLAGRHDAAAAGKQMETLVSRYPAAHGVHYLYGSFLLANDPDRAVAEFTAELANSSDHAGALSALAAEYLRRGDPAQGLPYAKRLLTALPDSVASHALFGRLLAEKGDLAEGARELEKARDLDPTDPQPHISLASVYAKLGRPADAAHEREAFLRVRDAAH